jgi:hypothetical protein
MTYTLYYKHSVLSRTEKGHGIFFFKKGTLHIEFTKMDT